MDSQFLFLVQIVAPVFVVMAAGFGMRKWRVLSAEADRSLIGIVVMLLAPALALDTIIGNDAFAKPANWILPPILGFGSVLLGIALSRLGARVFRLTDEKRRPTFVFVTSMQNYGYIAIPLCQALFDRETLGVLFAFVMGVEFGFWSIALWQLTGRPSRSGWWKSLNPPMLAIPGALVLNALGAGTWMPATLHTTFHLLGVCAVPMGLLLSGALLADYANLAALRHGGQTILASLVIRIGLFPALFILLAKALPVDAALKSVLIIEAAMPAAIFPIVVTRMHHGDVPTALQVVVGTSLVSLVTIPLWMGFGLAWVL